MPDGGDRVITDYRYTVSGPAGATLTVPVRVSDIAIAAVKRHPKRITRRSALTHEVFGYPVGQPVYAHFIYRNRARRTIRLGRAGGACGQGAFMVRRWPVRHAGRGTWLVQVDSSRRASSHTPFAKLAEVRLR